MSIQYRRILLKLSGEALAGDRGFGVEPGSLKRITDCVRVATQADVAVGIVIGGGNIHRGGRSELEVDRVRSDHMGMLATVINALALAEELGRQGIESRVMSALEMPQVAETYVRSRALKHLDKGRVVIFAGGTGCPYFTTDTTAALRALEIKADVLIKATRVDGIYDKDPLEHADAVFFAELDYDTALQKDLKIMDASAFSLCRDNGLEIRVMNINAPQTLLGLLRGEAVGSRVGARRG